MTARTLARQREEGRGDADLNEITARNVQKVTQFRVGGEAALEDAVTRLRDLEVGDRSAEEKRWGGKI